MIVNVNASAAGKDIKMAKTKLTKQIEHALCREFRRQYGCLEVSIGIGSQIKERCDYIVYDHYKDIFKCFEIKVSLADFKSSAAKSFVGHYNYYAMPWELYTQVADEIPKDIGVYVLSSNEFLSCEKKAGKRTLSEENKLLLKDSMIRSLSRDANKFYLADDDSLLENYKRELARTKCDRDSIYSENVKLQRDYMKLESVLEAMFGREYVREMLNKNG